MCVTELGHHWFRLCFPVCFFVKPFPQPMVTYCQLDIYERAAVEFEMAVEFESYNYYSLKMPYAKYNPPCSDLNVLRKPSCVSIPMHCAGTLPSQYVTCQLGRVGHVTMSGLTWSCLPTGYWVNLCETFWCCYHYNMINFIQDTYKGLIIVHQQGLNIRFSWEFEVLSLVLPMSLHIERIKSTSMENVSTGVNI